MSTAPVIFDIAYTPHHLKKGSSAKDIAKHAKERAFFTMTGDGDTIYRYMTREGKICGEHLKRLTVLEYLQKSTGVFNGDIGFVTRVDKVNGYVEVEFDDNRISQYTANDLGDLQLSYAITVHKSQGSEFDVAVIPLVNGPPTIINKNLLYTAITRAKKVVVLVGSKKVLAMMIHNNYIAARTTMLEWFLKLEEKKFNTFFTQDD